MQDLYPPGIVWCDEAVMKFKKFKRSRNTNVENTPAKTQASAALDGLSQFNIATSLLTVPSIEHHIHRAPNRT